MDSIGDNVKAIICVVVGILIIGCALVPIVDSASVVEKEETTVTPTSGDNTFTDSATTGVVTEATIVADGTSLTVNGESVNESISLYSEIGTSHNDIWFSNSVFKFVLAPAISGLESSITLTGTVSYSGDQLTITGTTADSTPYSQTLTIPTLYASSPYVYAGADDTDIYGFTSGQFVIGAGQKAVSQSGSTVVTLGTELPAGMTKTLSEDGSYATFAPSSGKWWAPFEWTGTITTTETTTSESEYSGLYAMIPVLCILGMAFVLIRRFY